MKKTRTMILMASTLLCSMAWAEPRTVVLNVPGMDCAVCPITIGKALERVEGVAEVMVDLESKQATVSFDDEVTDEATLTTATANVGYPSVVAKDKEKRNS